MHRLLILPIFLALLSPLRGQELVYPGDANHNGHVDHYDILSIGYAYGHQGPTRPPAGTFDPQPILEYWQHNFPDGLNYTHADVDNSGHVDFLDFLTLSLNNGFSYTDVSDLLFSNELPGAEAAVVIDQNGPVEASDYSGQTFEIPIRVTDLAPGRMINGIAMNLVFEPAYFTILNFEFSEEWINGDNGSFRIINESEGQIHLGITRFGVDPVEGEGTIGVLYLTIIEDLGGLLPVVIDTSLDLVALEDIQIFDENFQLVPVSSGPLMVNNSLPLSTSSHNFDELSSIASPNPADEQVSINAKYPFERVELFNASGHRQLLYQGVAIENWEASLSGYPPGKYYLRCTGRGGQSVMPLVIQR